MNYSKQIKALAKYLDCKPGEIDLDDYLILTDKEADEKCKENILELVWAFNPSFLSAHLKDGVDVDVISAIQSNDKCESNNTAILSLIKDVDHFVNDAIACDGRGHFLAQYDSVEIELGGDLYAYRIN